MKRVWIFRSSPKAALVAQWKGGGGTIQPNVCWKSSSTKNNEVSLKMPVL